jgi:choline-glycine betaine transporter
VIYGLVALYALFSLDRAGEILKQQFQALTKKQEKWALYGLIVLNLPVIFTVFGALTSQYE